MSEQACRRQGYGRRVGAAISAKQMVVATRRCSMPWAQAACEILLAAGPGPLGLQGSALHRHGQPGRLKGGWVDLAFDSEVTCPQISERCRHCWARKSLLHVAIESRAEGPEYGREKPLLVRLKRHMFDWPCDSDTHCHRLTRQGRTGRPSAPRLGHHRGFAIVGFRALVPSCCPSTCFASWRGLRPE